MRQFIGALICGLSFGSSACERGAAPSGALPSARPSAASLLVSSSKPLLSPSASAALPTPNLAPSAAKSPLPGLSIGDVLNCKGMAERGFEITLEGDGSAQAMREGSRIDTLSGTLRYCTAAGRYEAPLTGGARLLTLFGCVARNEPHKACISVSEQSAQYLDRDGTPWRLQVANVRTTTRGDTLEGTASFTARRERITKNLRVRFRVGTRIPAVPEEQSPYFAPR